MLVRLSESRTAALILPTTDAASDVIEVRGDDDEDLASVVAVGAEGGVSDEEKEEVALPSRGAGGGAPVSRENI